MAVRYSPSTFVLSADIGDAANGFFEQSLAAFAGRLPPAEFEMHAEVDGERLLLVTELPLPVGRIEFTVQKGYWMWADAYRKRRSMRR